MKQLIYLFLMEFVVMSSMNLSASPIPPNQSCDILVVGGSLGGCAAALQACQLSEKFGIDKVIMTEETDWPGGQYTSQAVVDDPSSALTEGRYNIAASELYYQFHNNIRDLYRDKAMANATTTHRNGGPGTKAYKDEINWIKSNRFSPGLPWGSRIGFPPPDGVTVLTTMFKPWQDKGTLNVYYKVKPVEVIKQGNKVIGVKFQSTDKKQQFTVKAKVVLDATELGDLLPLSGTAYRLGVDASDDTKEPSLFDTKGNPLIPEAVPTSVQSFTYPFTVEWCKPGEDQRLPWESRPKSYEKNRSRYSLRDYKNPSGFLMNHANEYAKSIGKGGSACFWTYRRVLTAAILDPKAKTDAYPRFRNGKWITDLTPDAHPELFIPCEEQAYIGDLLQVNWGSNDYYGHSIVDVPDEEREKALQEAKELSLGFLYYLWYECPRDPDDSRKDPSVEANWSIDPATGKNRGYSNLKFRPDVHGTEDGLSKFPYIREARRVKGLVTIKQQDIMGPSDKRANLFEDSVGIGQYYMMDIHHCVPTPGKKWTFSFKETTFRDGTKGREGNVSKFQIPYGALVPETTDGLLMACKDLGTTHITNGTYRLHPVEFQIGQAAGTAATLCAAWRKQPRELWSAEESAKPDSAEMKLRRLQFELIRSKMPLYWVYDCGWDKPGFEAVQWVCLLNLLPPHSLNFKPEEPLTRRDAVIAAVRLAGLTPEHPKTALRFKDVKTEDTALVSALQCMEEITEGKWMEGDTFNSTAPVTESQFEKFLNKVMPDRLRDSSSTKKLTRGEAARILFSEIAKRYDLPVE
jgi:hypothetical protein